MEVSEISNIINEMIAESENEIAIFKDWLLKNNVAMSPDAILSTTQKILRNRNRILCLQELKGKAGI